MTVADATGRNKPHSNKKIKKILLYLYEHTYLPMGFAVQMHEIIKH